MIIPLIDKIYGPQKFAAKVHFLFILGSPPLFFFSFRSENGIIYQKPLILRVL
jgi:hypothetical protein